MVFFLPGDHHPDARKNKDAVEQTTRSTAKPTSEVMVIVFLEGLGTQHVDLTKDPP